MNRYLHKLQTVGFVERWCLSLPLFPERGITEDETDPMVYSHLVVWFLFDELLKSKGPGISYGCFLTKKKTLKQGNGFRKKN